MERGRGRERRRKEVCLNPLVKLGGWGCSYGERERERERGRRKEICLNLLLYSKTGRVGL